mgnify:CR=1 FL=1
MNESQYEGPRRIRLEEAHSGGELFEICFGENLTDAIAEAQPTRRGGWYVIVHHGKVVSQLGLSHSEVVVYGSRLRIGSVGGVSTHSDYRGQGLAGRLLAHGAAQLAQEGARLMLISGERGLYTRTGNTPAMRFNTFSLKVPLSAPIICPRVAIRPLQASDLSGCARLYQAEPVHFVRRVEDFQDALGHQRGWGVMQGGELRAYFLWRTPWEFMDAPERGVREVTEYAGSRLALAEGLRQVLAGEASQPSPLRELRLAIPWQDFDLFRLLESVHQAAGAGTLPDHTMRLINFPALRQDLANYIAARLPISLRRGLRFEQSGPLLVDPWLGEAGEGRMAITWQGGRQSAERFELSSAEMTRLVMGSSEQAGDGAPPPAKGALGEVVSALFPLPSFLVGINYC